MKFHILLFACMFLPCVLCGIPDEMKELAATLHKTCVDESGVDEALIDKVNTQRVFEDDEKLKCYLMCLSQQTGCLDESGVLDIEATIAILPDDLRDHAAPIIKMCAEKADSSNTCQSAWLIHKCYLEHEADTYFLI